MNTVKNRTTRMVLTAVFAAIIIVMASIPQLGYINLGIISATTLHIPVVVGSILLGPQTGALLGAFFGLTSCIKATFTPNLTSFCFSPFIANGNMASLLVCFVPRILIGIVSPLVYRGMHFLLGKLVKKKEVTTLASLAVAGLAGSMTNTLLVMNLIYVFFIDLYAAATGYEAVYSAILVIIVSAGVPEAIVCAILTTAICRVMLPLVRQTR
ncbi:MAG: ECF transporter S component [Lachnospiraceae bacterium]|nr:ECF transporter S component [Lachnospiraceae bacterium]